MNFFVTNYTIFIMYIVIILSIIIIIFHHPSKGLRRFNFRSQKTNQKKTKGFNNLFHCKFDFLR